MLGLIEILMEDYELSVLLVSRQPDEIAPLCRRIAFIAEGGVAWHGASSALGEEAASMEVRRYLGGASRDGVDHVVILLI
ncbi:hypothetical protein [Halotalea alkalilenta]|uniref:ABC transporter domain-containing protein n=1 Tax=Halotalea alkalilenta TaxID=376489 RepID=A0A172YBS9_9GAMM|nr:hypothetical protein [Halotalea alkalilenta]ANF56674.1 hypothetical protein A5892_03670 [Halotalea alkalilenta]